MPMNVLTDAEVKLTGYLSERSILNHSDSFDTTMKKMIVSLLFLTNAKHLSALDVANLYKKKMVGWTIFQMAKKAAS